MSEQSSMDIAAPDKPVVRRIIARFFRLAAGFWHGPTARRAWVLTGAIVVLVVTNLFVQVGINRWNKFFFDALEQKDTASVKWGIGLALVLAFFCALNGVLFVHARMRLQVRWREWLGGRLIERWLAERRFYQLNIVQGDAANPEGRIAEDTRVATEPLVDITIGLANAVLTAITFTGVLWVMGGSWNFGAFELPGYMVFGVIGYSALLSVGTILIGKPLIAAVKAKNAEEARLRSDLTGVRENAEIIALVGGDDKERDLLKAGFAAVILRWQAVIWQQANLTWVTNANAVLAGVVPLLLAGPKYLSGEITLGTLMQIAAAFVQVQAALNWLLDNTIRIAEWLASAVRVIELDEAMDNLDATIGHGTKETIVLADSQDDALHIENLSITQYDGKLMIEGAAVVIAKGEKVLVRGDSGSGKSTLIRAMAGLWPWGSGRILRPKAAKIAFMPQKPYLPDGTLRACLLYPAQASNISDELIGQALQRCGLAHLAMQLDIEGSWGHILSGGEQQRIAFARLLLNPPDIAIMDEATSALDEEGQARMMAFLRTDLAASTVLSVGHRPNLEQYHEREIRLTREPGQDLAHASNRRLRRGEGFWRRFVDGLMEVKAG